MPDFVWADAAPKAGKIGFPKPASRSGAVAAELRCPAAQISRQSAAVPDLRWAIKDILVAGDQIVVRGEATGTPQRELFGAKPSGRSFKTMSIDVFKVKAGKLASAYHVENWVGALQQISK